MNINFTAHSMTLMIRVFKAVGYGELLASVENFEDLQKKDKQKQMGKKLIQMIFERRGYAERELNAFLEAVTGVKNIENMNFKEYRELEQAVFGHEDFQDFFMSAQASVMEMFKALK